MERFGVPDHDAQVTNHALQNPTAQGSFANIGGGGDTSWGQPAASYSGGGYTQPGVHGGMPLVLNKPRTKSTVIAIVLALVFGPFGVLYTSFVGAVVLFAVTALIGIVTGGGVQALDHDSIMMPIWRMMVVVSVIATVILAKRFNAREKKRWDESHPA